MCCFFNKAYLRIPFDIIKQYKVILLYHCWNHVVFSFIVVKDAASHSTNYSLPPLLPSLPSLARGTAGGAARECWEWEEGCTGERDEGSPHNNQKLLFY